MVRCIGFVSTDINAEFVLVPHFLRSSDGRGRRPGPAGGRRAEGASGGEGRPV